MSASLIHLQMLNHKQTEVSDIAFVVLMHFFPLLAPVGVTDQQIKSNMGRAQLQLSPRNFAKVLTTLVTA